MRTLAILILPLALALTGCETLTRPVHGKPSVEAPALATARTAIDESYATLIAVNRVISQNLDDKIWTPEQARPILQRSIDYRKRLDQARELLRAGDPLSAENQAKLLRELILALHREVAAQARKQP